MKERFAVIALGGNAILRKDQPAEPSVQMANLRQAVDNLASALDRYTSFALTHGNGPQVGNDLIRSYRAWETTGLPQLGLTDCVANTQGRIGHWIVREMKNHPRFTDIPVACVLTHVYVEKNRFSLDEYTKGIGPFLPNTPEMRADFDSRGIVYHVSEDRRELRRVVPSPNPVAIEEFRAIADMVGSGTITICCGGGGIPIFDPSRGDGNASDSPERFLQSEVVIDKDRASSLLASGLLTENRFEGADIDLVILMEAKGLYRDSKCREEDFIPEMTLDELEQFIEESDLQAGTILPKLEAIRDFLEAGGREAFLGPLDGFAEVFEEGEPVGTRFVNSPQLHLY
jgi:carbamate kinase